MRKETNTMKKKLFVTIMLTLLIFSCFLQPVLASEPITLEINGLIITPNVAPVIENGTTLVPLRIISENLGAKVTWEMETQSILIEKENSVIMLEIGKTSVLVNNQAKTMTLAPKIINGSTMVPIRFVSENLGVFVNWDGDSRTVQISNTGKFVKPIVSKYDELTVKFIDVGQADSILLSCGGEALLIDGGNKGDSQKIYTVLRDAGIKHLKAIIVTHAHEDHCGGIAAALTACSADTVYSPVTLYDSEAFQDILKRTQLTVPKVGQSFQIGSARIVFLGPLKQYHEENNTSIVCKVMNGEDSFLFTGDMEQDAEKDLIASNEDISVDVLKVGHHGSDSSSSYVFLREVMPEYAVISCGAGNNYGHPTDIVLSRLRDAGTTLYRTDLHGDITFKSKGNGVTVTTQKQTYADVWTSGDGIKSGQVTIATQSGQADNYIGNKNSKIFHLDSCGGLPIEKNRIYFTNRSDAVNMGYRPCQRCNP